MFTVIFKNKFTMPSLSHPTISWIALLCSACIDEYSWKTLAMTKLSADQPTL